MQDIGKIIILILHLIYQEAKTETEIIKGINLELGRKIEEEFSNQEIRDLIYELKKLDFFCPQIIFNGMVVGTYFRLSAKGRKFLSRIKDEKIKKYFRVAAMIYFNQGKYTANELCILLEGEIEFYEVRGIIDYFEQYHAVEDKFIKDGKGIIKCVLFAKDCIFDIFLIEDC